MIRTPHFATFIHKVVLVGFVTLGLVISTSAQSARQPVPIELSLTPYVANLRTLSVTVGGETAPFLLDTGGGFTAVTPEFARAIGCVAFGRVTGFRSSGERIDMLRCGAVSMMLGPAPFRTEAAIFDLMSLLKGAPPIAGVVSLHTLQARSFTLDLAANRLVVETQRSLAQRIKGMSKLSIRTSRQAGGASVDLFLEVGTPHGSIWLELDSGNAGPVLISPHALTQLGLSLSGDQPRPVTLDVRGLGTVPVECATKELIYDGLLNAAFLESIILTVDLPSGRAWASKRK